MAERSHRTRRVAGAVVSALLVVGASACAGDDDAVDDPGSSTPDGTDDTGTAVASPWLVAGCERDGLGGHSVARVWDDTTLSMIRRVVPAPTVHARNLFHLSAAMWDAWAAYDDVAAGYFVTERHTAPDDDRGGDAHAVQAAREVAMSYAAYRLLTWRYGVVSDLADAADELDGVMASLCLDPAYDTTVDPTDGTDDPAAFGNRIAATVLDATRDDGALEDERYVDSSYRPVNEPLLVDQPGTVLVDPDRWQPLSLGKQVSQNGLEIPGNVQEFIGPHWGHVTSFALPPSDAGTPIDPGPPPRLDDPDTADAYRDSAVDVIRYGSLLDATNGVTIDIGPGAMGANPLGTNDGIGHPIDPSTGEPYAPDVVPLGDFGRVIAEFWADGPQSETPPGHWNVLANAVADSPGFERRLGGEGPGLDPLEWDVKVYLVLNGALHDAAVAAWGLKGRYDSIRPISMIRYLGGFGQSTDPDGPAYDARGLPLEPGLVEVVTAESSAPGERHADLADHVGEVVVRAWLGSPDDPTTETSGVGWVRAVEWVPYQRPTFVTPAFAGYVSGHSTFSRAGAEVMSAVTGDEYFPGGMTTYTIEAGGLRHEDGPTVDVTLQWATYADAADQAGISRLYGGIHVPADDVTGRIVGAEVGTLAWTHVQQYYDGTATG